MRKAPSAGISHPRPEDEGSQDRLSVLTWDESPSSDSDAAPAERGMKRSRGFSTSFSLEEDPQPLSSDEDTEEDEESAKEADKPEALLEGPQASRSGGLRPQDLWLAMYQCLAFRWPPCLSLNRPGKNPAARSAGERLSADQNPPRRSASRAENGMREKDEVPSEGPERGPALFRGVSRSSPRLPSAGLARDLASALPERDTFLRIELVDAGEGGQDSRYRAEWKLSETAKDLARGVWFSRNRRTMD